MEDAARFARIYDRIVRRFWATSEPLEEGELRRMVEAEGLSYPANRATAPLSPAAALRCPA